MWHPTQGDDIKAQRSGGGDRRVEHRVEWVGGPSCHVKGERERKEVVVVVRWRLLWPLRRNTCESKRYGSEHGVAQEKGI